ncbi:MAG: hypothetical protein AB1425_11655 [Actinomycetota bacterium]
MNLFSDLATTLRRALARTVAAVAGLCVVILLSDHGLCLDPEHGLPLLAAMGTVGCVGQLLAFLSRLRLGPGGAPAVSRPLSGPALAPERAKRGEDWPLLVALLFGRITVLLSGLGGWVKARQPAPL